MLALLTIVGLSMALMLGLITKGRTMASIGKLFVGLLLFPVLLGIGRSIWAGLDLVTEAVLVLFILPIFLLLGIRAVFGREVYGEFTGRLLYDLFIGLFRGIGLLLRLMGRGFIAVLRAIH